MPTLQLEVALGYGWIEGLQEEEMIPFVMRAHSLGARGVALFARGGGTICPITYNITNRLSNYYAARSATPCAEGVIEDYWRYVPQAGRAKLKKTPKGKREKTNPFPCPCSPWLLATYCMDFFPSFWRIFYSLPKALVCAIHVSNRVSLGVAYGFNG